MILSFKQWLEDCGPVTKDYSNAADSDSGRKLSQLRSNRSAGKRKPEPADFNADKLFGIKMKKKMRK